MQMYSQFYPTHAHQIRFISYLSCFSRLQIKFWVNQGGRNRNRFLNRLAILHADLLINSIAQSDLYFTG